MTCFVSHTSVDCTDAYALAEFWKSVLGYTDLEGDPNNPGDEECGIVDPTTGHMLLFIQVPESKAVKNRIHLDLRPRDGSRDDEVKWLQEMGARILADRRGIYGAGTGWVTFADPEGNEFCVLRSEAELPATS